MNTTPPSLAHLAITIRQWQVARGISDNEMCRQFSGLGSTKTYKRILAGDAGDLDLDRWRVEYEQVWTLIQLQAQGGEEEPVYDDLWHISASMLAVKDAMTERGNHRLVIVEGPSGSGKTTAGRCLAARLGRKVVLAEADETWKESLCAMLGGILRALGARDLPTSTEERKQRALALLQASPVCLVIDEAHHLGPRTLNMVKTLLNQTPCQIVFLCIQTLFRKLECAAYEEAKQLTKNRLGERIRLGGPPVADVAKFLARRLRFESDDLARQSAKLCADQASQHGAWAFVNLVARRARQLAGATAVVDQETFARAVTKTLQSR